MHIKGEIDSNTVKAGDFNTPLILMEKKSPRQKIKKERNSGLKCTLDQMDLIDIIREFHPKAAEYAFCSSAYGTFSRIEHMLEHKTSLSKFKINEIISSMFSDHNGIKLEINHKKKPEKHTNSQRINNMLLNN